MEITSGYLAYLDETTDVGPIARSYISEALDAYRGDCYKASVILVRIAVEKLTTDLMAKFVSRLRETNRSVPHGLGNEKEVSYSIMFSELQGDLYTDVRRNPNDKNKSLLCEELEWRSPYVIGLTRRNRCSLAPIRVADAHASLLLLVSTAKLLSDLRVWIPTYYV